MKQTFNIGEIANFFQLPASTLRYWEETGLITPSKNTQNDYREYSLSDLMTISDILFYKNLGLSLNQISKMEQTEVAYHQQLFQEKMVSLEKQKKQLDRQIQ